MQKRVEVSFLDKNSNLMQKMIEVPEIKINCESRVKENSSCKFISFEPRAEEDRSVSFKDSQEFKPRTEEVRSIIFRQRDQNLVRKRIDVLFFQKKSEPRAEEDSVSLQISCGREEKSQSHQEL